MPWPGSKHLRGVVRGVEESAGRQVLSLFFRTKVLRVRFKRMGQAAMVRPPSGSIGAPVQLTVSSAIERAAPEPAPAPAPEPVSDLDQLFAALTRGGLFGGGDNDESDARSTGRED